MKKSNETRCPAEQAAIDEIACLVGWTQPEIASHVGYNGRPSMLVDLAAEMAGAVVAAAVRRALKGGR